MKKYIFLAASALALASCQSDDFLGNTPGSTPSSANSAIKFDGNAGKISRATSNTDPTDQGKLDYQFKIYGVKKVADNKYSDVFKNYSIWYNTTHTTSNTNNWEYVGSGQITTGDNNQTIINLGTNSQTIKYWDYASDNYHFVAGSPIDNFTYKLDNNGNIASAEIQGLGGHITANTGTKANTFNPVYVAAPVVVTKDNYKNAVTFNFVRQQTKVRVGIYETIPGYSISKINFYAYDNVTKNLKVSEGNNIILTSGTDKYFSGSTDINTKNTGTIKYDWTKLKYTFTYDQTNLTESKNWYGGKLAGGVKAKVSSHTNIDELYGTDADMEKTGYFTVLPTPSAMDPKPIFIKCDYTLTADDKSGETINVKGATAAIPAAYSKWNTNTLYTYIFKISENTNGYTGSDDPGHVGLYPITFDAAVEAPQFGMQGTITTFTTPSITTYQVGSVTDDGIKYVANKKIEVTVTESKSGTKLNLSTTGSAVGHITVYKFTDPITEAEVQVKGTTGETEVTDGIVAENVYSFTPDGEGYYAIQYLTTAADGDKPAAYTYKVVYVAAN